MEFHPAANLFPLLEEQELEELAGDIREHGLLSPITTYQGMILDGRNRFLACERAGVEPRFQEWDGTGSPTDWVLSLNLYRRHLTDSQKAAVGAEAENLYAEEARERQRQTQFGNQAAEPVVPNLARPGKGRSREKAAALVGVSTGIVGAAKRLMKAEPELFEQIKLGKLTVHRAEQIVKRRQGAPRPRRTVPRYAGVTERLRGGEALAEEGLPENVRQALVEFDRSLAIDLSQRYRSIPLDTWFEVAAFMRQRMARALTPYKLIRASGTGEKK